MRKLLFVLSLFLSLAACKHKDNPAPSCPINEVRKGDTCACDKNFLRYKGKCEFVGNGDYYFKVVSSTCKDWKDSVIIAFDSTQKLEYFETDSKGLVGRFVFGWRSSDDRNGHCWNTFLCHYTTGTQYDTLIYYGEELIGGKLAGNKYNWYLAMNKNKDSIFATFCNTTSKPLSGGHYPNLDTCFLTFERIN